MKILIVLTFFLLFSQNENIAQMSTEEPIEITEESNELEVDERGYHVKVGDIAPDFEMNWIDGSTHRLSEFKGKVVVLQFTASWCSVCRKEAPHLEQEVWLPNKDNDFILIGIDRDEPLEKVQAFIEKLQTTYPVSLDPGADIFALFASKKSGVTRNIVIDQEGKIAFLTRLFKQEEFDAMKTKIAELQAKK